MGLYHDKVYQYPNLFSTSSQLQMRLYTPIYAILRKLYLSKIKGFTVCNRKNSLVAKEFLLNQVLPMILYT